MKKFVFILVVLFSFCFLNSCDDKRDNDDTALKEFNEKMYQYDTALANAKDMTMDMRVTVADTVEEFTIKMGKNPLIIEVITNNHKMYEIVDENTIYEYSIFDKLYNKRLFTANKDEIIELNNLFSGDFQQSGLYNDVPKDLSDINFSNFSFQNDIYHFDAKLSDLALGADGGQLKELLGDDNFLNLDFEDVIINFKISIKDDVLNYVMFFTLEMDINGKTHEFPISIVLNLQYDQNNLTDLSKLEYTKPQDFEYICDYTDFSKPLKVESSESYMGQFTMKKGLYYLNFENRDFESFYYTTFTIYDKDKNLIKPCFEITPFIHGGNYEYLDDSSYYYNLEYDGLYYFRVRNSLDKENEISFIKLDKTVEELKTFNALETSTITLKDKYDVKFFEGNVIDTTVYEITNNSLYDINFGYSNTSKSYTSQYDGGIIKPGETKYFEANEGNVIFTVTHFNKSDDINNIEIPLDIVKYNAIGDLSYNESNSELSSEEKCIYLNEYDSKNIKLKFNESKIISFKSLNNKVNIKFNSIENIKQIGDYYLVPAGEYILSASNHSENKIVDFIKYEEVDSQLNKITSSFEFSYCSTYNDKNSFSYLDVEEAGVYNLEFEDKIRSFRVLKMSDFSFVSMIGEVWCYLEPAKYLLYCDIYDAAEYKIKYVSKEYKELEEVEVELVYYDDLDYNPPYYLYNNKNLRVKDEQIVKYWFNLDKEYNIILQSRYIVLYDSNGNQLTYNGNNASYNTVIKLAAGRYYFICTELSRTIIDLLIFKTNYDGYNIFSNNMSVLNNNETLTLEPDKKEKLYSYYVINIEEDGTYLLEFNNMDGVVFDENRQEIECIKNEYIAYGQYKKKYELKKGKYYFQYNDFYLLENASVFISKS